MQVGICCVLGMVLCRFSGNGISPKSTDFRSEVGDRGGRMKVVFSGGILLQLQMQEGVQYTSYRQR